MYFPDDMNFQYFFFDTYIGYFLQVLPIAIIVGTIYGIIKYKNDKETKLLYKICSCLFISYITGLVCLVLGLNIISNIWYWIMYRMDSGNSIRFFDFTYNFIPYFNFSGEMIGNFIMFLPFGMLYPLKKEKITLKRTILVGIGFVCIIEFLQPIFARAFDINDIILNTLGIILSSLVFFVIKYLYIKAKKEA